MGIPGPQKINRYGIAFKLKAVQMSNQPGVLIKDVAESLCIHPFMLSRWRKEVRDGELVGKVAPIDAPAVAELKRLREVELQYTDASPAGLSIGRSSSAPGSRIQNAHPRSACDRTCSPPGRAHHTATSTRSPK